MSGAYAHITLVNRVCTTPFLDSIPGFPDRAKSAVLNYKRYCELGSVSPDLPYLDLLHPGAAAWADLMHKEMKASFFDAVIKGIRVAREKKRAAQKGTAWILGFAAHVFTDLTIHPVVMNLVGPYEGNESNHQACEMHQDAYIFPILNIGEIGGAEYLEKGIGLCASNGDELDSEIQTLWLQGLVAAYPDHVQADNPDMDSWFKGFQGLMDVAEEGYKLIPLVRGMAVKGNLTYPNPEDVDPRWIRNLPTPTTTETISYDTLFEKAVERVAWAWAEIGQGIFSESTGGFTAFQLADLDTGRDESGTLPAWA